MIVIITLSIIIVFVILLLCVITTSKAYDYKHTVDPLTKNQDEKKQVRSFHTPTFCISSAVFLNHDHSIEMLV